MSSTFTMYTTPWCGYCHRLKGQLDREGIDYDVVDIEQHPRAPPRSSSRPTTATRPCRPWSTADGTAQTNPSLTQVKQKLEQLAS